MHDSLSLRNLRFQTLIMGYIDAVVLNAVQAQRMDGSLVILGSTVSEWAMMCFGEAGNHDTDMRRARVLAANIS